jgi:hypothetical protein
MAPPPSEERLVFLVRCALAEPPDDAAFATMQPTMEEETHYRNVLRLRREEPDSAMLGNLRRRVEQLDGLRITFTTDKLITETPDGTQVTSYQVEEDLGDRVIIVEQGPAPIERRRAVISFDGDDRIVITKGPTRIPMTRVAAGTPRPPTEVPHRPPAGAGPSAGLASPPAEAGEPLEFEPCAAAYLACLDAMPPEAQSAMAESRAVVEKRVEQARSAPEERESFTEACNRALRLAKSSMLCP